MTAELKPCPFCGDEVEFEHSYREDYNKYPRDFWHVRISCCNANTGWYSYGEQEEEICPPEIKAKAEADIARQWNRRS